MSYPMQFSISHVFKSMFFYTFSQSIISQSIVSFITHNPLSRFLLSFFPSYLAPKQIYRKKFYHSQHIYSTIHYSTIHNMTFPQVSSEEFLCLVFSQFPNEFADLIDTPPASPSSLSLSPTTTPPPEPISTSLPYICKGCAKPFATAHALKSHATSHSPDRPYKCLGCNSRFKRYAKNIFNG
jgi:DNA-directed RNA polymerase subunit RPC12/RpoP